jgi:hypothetical protein
MKTPEEIAYDAGRQALAVQESLVTGSVSARERSSRRTRS